MTDEPNQVDLSAEQNDFIPKESPSPIRIKTEQKRIEHTDTQMTEISVSTKYDRTAQVEEKSTTKIVGVKGIEQGSNEKEIRPLANTTSDILKGEKRREPTTRDIAAAPLQGTTTSTNIQYKSRTETREQVSQEKKTPKLSEKIEPPLRPPPRSPTAHNRQLPADPRGQQTTKENSTIKTSHTSQEVTVTKEQRTPATKPLSELSSNSNATTQSVTAAPKSTKTRVAPPVPQSSESTSGRSQVTPLSDTSGYPASFSNRKSRDSRELTETGLQQLGK